MSVLLLGMAGTVTFMIIVKVLGRYLDRKQQCRLVPATGVQLMMSAQLPDVRVAANWVTSLKF